jgi:hypothetical protein
MTVHCISNLTQRSALLAWREREFAIYSELEACHMHTHTHTRIILGHNNNISGTA